MDISKLITYEPVMTGSDKKHGSQTSDTSRVATLDRKTLLLGMHVHIGDPPLSRVPVIGAQFSAMHVCIIKYRFYCIVEKIQKLVSNAMKTMQQHRAIPL
jgi:hypothetical protein